MLRLHLVQQYSLQTITTARERPSPSEQCRLNVKRDYKTNENAS